MHNEEPQNLVTFTEYVTDPELSLLHVVLGHQKQIIILKLLYYNHYALFISYENLEETVHFKWCYNIDIFNTKVFIVKGRYCSPMGHND